MVILDLHTLFLESTGVTTDTRSVQKGNIFFALKGDNFDGNKFAQNAIDSGASFVVIDNPVYNINSKCILVENVLDTLQNLSAFHRNYLNIPIIAITGTNGKTTTKELVREVLARKFQVKATQGNLNNHIGVPLTLLSFDHNVEVGIVEMGANHIGEIELLCSIAQPDFGLITNIGRAHIEGFGSFNGVIKAKSELYKYIAKNKGKAFINSDDKLLQEQASAISVNTIPYCKVDESVGGFFASVEWEGSAVKSNLVGDYNVPNICAAITVANFFGVDSPDIISAINDYQPKNNRSQLIAKNSYSIIIDAYNANPSSMDVAINNLARINCNVKCAVLGDMLELGDVSPEEHKLIVDNVLKLNFDKVVFVGRNFYQHKVDLLNVLFYSDFADYKQSGDFSFPDNSTILVKGSRGIGLERLLELI